MTNFLFITYLLELFALLILAVGSLAFKDYLTAGAFLFTFYLGLREA